MSEIADISEVIIEQRGRALWITLNRPSRMNALNRPMALAIHRALFDGAANPDIDRIVIDSRFRRHGIGRVFYSDILSFAEIRYPLLTCEVFIEPRDDVSLVFFGTNGFHEVGQQILQNGRRVSMMIKEMKAYPFVQATYSGPGVVDLPNALNHDRLSADVAAIPKGQG